MASFEECIVATVGIHETRSTELRIASAFGNALLWRVAVLATLALQLVLTLSHHAWVDEWQALQIATETPTLAALLENLRYEGHPPLWYFLLRVVAWVVPVPWVMPATAALLAVAAQSIVLLKSPFERRERLMIAIGVFMMFEFMTVSRGTTLGVALTLAAVVVMRSRWVWLMIALLPMVDFMFGAVSLVFIALLVRDKRLWWPGAALWFAASAAAAWTVIPAPDFVPANQLTSLAFDSAGWLKRLGVMLVPLQMAGDNLQWESHLPLSLGWVAGPIFLCFAYCQTRHDQLHLALMTGFLLLTYAFSVMVYPQHVRHLAVIALVLYILKWRDVEAGRRNDRPFKLWLAVGAVCGLVVAGVNFVRPFDQAHLAAKFITDNKLQDKHWLVYPENRAQGISALIGMTFERVGQNCTQTFVRWNARTDFADAAALDAYLRNAVQRNGRFYLLTDFPVVTTTTGLAHELATFTGSYRGQDYYINVVGRDHPERKTKRPACIPNLRAR
jgi:hypothetical protein